MSRNNKMEITPGTFDANDEAGPSNSSEGLWSDVSDDDLFEHFEEYVCLDEGVLDSRQRKTVPPTTMDRSSYIATPSDIKHKNAVINPRNKDQKCFKWAILVKHVTPGHRGRVNKHYFEHEDKYDFTGLTFPTPLHEVDVFENNNPTVSVNVYGLQRRENKTHVVTPLKLALENKKNHIDLLLLTKKKKSHYTCITNYSRLFRSQFNKYAAHEFVCKKCLTHTDKRLKKISKAREQAALDQHKPIRGAHEPILSRSPSIESMLKMFELDS